VNLIKLYTRHGALMVDTSQLQRACMIKDGRCLTIYTLRGNRLSDTAPTKEARMLASFGVHVGNLFATMELAQADSERILAAMYGRSITPKRMFEGVAS
jgi:hypothetical protein